MSDERKCSRNCPYTILSILSIPLLSFYFMNMAVYGIWCLVFVYCTNKYCTQIGGWYILHMENCGIGSLFCLSILFGLWEFWVFIQSRKGCHIFISCPNIFRHSCVYCRVAASFIQRSVYLNNFLVANLSDKQRFLCFLIINTRMRFLFIFFFFFVFRLTNSVFDILPFAIWKMGNE